MSRQTCSWTLKVRVEVVLTLLFYALVLNEGHSLVVEVWVDEAILFWLIMLA